MSGLPPCPTCDADGLRTYGAEVQGLVWTFCTQCGALVLVRRSDQTIIRVGKR